MTKTKILPTASGRLTTKNETLPPGRYKPYSATMRIITLALVFFIFLSKATAQIHIAQDSIPEEMNRIEFNPLCFILGTLSDYLGRFYYVDKPDQIDRYYQHEKSLMSFLDSLIFEDFGIKVSSNERNETFSKEIAKKLNSYYGKDKLLNLDLFRYRDQIYSFITGKYYRYGRQINDTLYAIQLANSPNHKICDILLRKTNCTNIHFKYLKNIPAQFIYFFVPSLELKKQFELISKQNEILRNDYFESIREIMDMNTDEFNKIKAEIHEKDLFRIKELIDNPENNK